MQTLQSGLAAVHERIAHAARRAGRPPEEVALVAVTKTHPPELIAAALEAGITHIGENKVQEAAQKFDSLHNRYPHAHWHLIGHLQRNKAKQAAGIFTKLHTLDSLRLAEALNRHLEGQNDTLPRQRLPVLLQINVSGEQSKEGFLLPGDPDNQAALPSLLSDIEPILALPRLEVRGLMTIAPLAPDPEAARPVFRRLRRLRDTLARHFPHATWDELSMGMSDDFEVAIEEGATWVRLGRALFGARHTNANR